MMMMSDCSNHAKHANSAVTAHICIRGAEKGRHRSGKTQQPAKMNRRTCVRQSVRHVFLKQTRKPLCCFCHFRCAIEQKHRIIHFANGAIACELRACTGKHEQAGEQNRAILWGKQQREFASCFGCAKFIWFRFFFACFSEVRLFVCSEEGIEMEVERLLPSSFTRPQPGCPVNAPQHYELWRFRRYD